MSGSLHDMHHTGNIRVAALNDLGVHERDLLYPRLTSMLSAGCAEEQEFTSTGSALLELGCRDLQQDLLSGGAGWLVAWHEATPIGLVCLASAGSSAPSTGVLAGLYVAPEWRRQGIGRYLVLAAVDAAKKRGLRSVAIYVAAQSPARHLYEQLGLGEGTATEHADFIKLEWRLGNPPKLYNSADNPERKEACRVLDKKTITFLLRAIAVAMGIAGVVLCVLQPLQQVRISMLLSIGLASLAISNLND